MEMYSVQILNPKAVRLLEDLADLEMIALQPKMAKQPLLTEGERVAAREAVLRGSPDLDLAAMLDHLRESRQDRKMPFRNAVTDEG